MWERHCVLRVCLAVLGGVLWSAWGVSETIAQDRPAIARPDSPSKASKEQDSSRKSASANKASTEGAGEKTQPTVNIGKILPKGRILRGVKLPSYSGDRLSSLMTAITMKRLDETHLDMEELRIIMYAKPGEKNTLISTERGIYDLEKEEITSETRTRVEQEGIFDLEGDLMVFDANTQKGKMTGNVKMLLYKADKQLMPSGKGTDKGKEKREEEGK